ncbi:DUF3060 domain-containing protein [Mycobacterium sp. ITM-2016-00318]|uniref:DUF3060 domain-containing protein n=1 Tax=Mycobacterium sp. ITM-2016-00318 TaxID=2099693 RepID=UPI000CF8C4F5|nr:DUF3060 domain-containing protein [Mycobacterium sp. ITM-2016-00318]WNG93747.1 DUF3060 domain-containing protein [Mycobacterium sp. ITM-2016-00318]
MNPEDDPEARIRALEQPLSDQARSSELGGGQAGGDTAYLPPPTSAYTPPDYSTPAYETQQYGAQPFATQPYGRQQYGAQPYGTSQWGAQPYGAPPQRVSGGIPWLVFGLIAVVFIAVAAGVIIFMTRTTSVTTPGDSSVSSGGGSVDIDIPSAPPMPPIEIPGMPDIPAPPGAPNADPNVITGAPGQTVTISGIDENKTVACNDAAVTISGIRNTVTITGHCAEVSVSGIENKITVDAADKIGASGFDNVVSYISGTPQIDAVGSNTVQQG